MIFLSINGYDVILGMDWLSRYYVQIDYKIKDVNLRIPGETVIRLNFKRTQKTLGIVSGEQTRKLLKKIAVGYIVYLVNQSNDKAQVEQVPMTKKFLDVFPEELIPYHQIEM